MFNVIFPKEPPLQELSYRYTTLGTLGSNANLCVFGTVPLCPKYTRFAVVVENENVLSNLLYLSIMKKYKQLKKIHSDYIGVVTGHTRQTVVLMERSGVNSTSYSNIHLGNSHSQIAFNVITFDDENNLLKINRVGNNTDIWLQSKNSICYNYNTHKVIACE